MAKKSKVVKNIQRQEIVNRFSKKRKELKAIIKDPNSTYQEKRQRTFTKADRKSLTPRHLRHFTEFPKHVVFDI